MFGNSGGDSGAGVAFSRNPATGAKELYVDFLRRAGRGHRIGSAHAGRRGAAETAHAGGLAPVGGRSARARGRLPRRSGHGVHGRARPAVLPADASGQAHPARGAEDRSRFGGGGPHWAQGRSEAAGRRPTSKPPAFPASPSPPRPSPEPRSLLPASLAARSASRPRRRRRPRRAASLRSWSGATRRPKTSRGLPSPPESSRRSAVAPPTPRSWRGSWERSAWSAAARS